MVDIKKLRKIVTDKEKSRVKKDWSIRDLFQSRIKHSPKKKKFTDTNEVTLDRIIPFAGTDSALFQLSMDGVTEDTRHRVNILCRRIMVQTTKPTRKQEKADFIQVDDKDGITYWVEEPNASTDLVKIRCTCKDYYFVWGWWNFKDNAMFGRQQRPYRRKTPAPPRGKPYVNPKKLPGLCKHVYHAVKHLQRRGYWD
jgi:hypothetical protein